jgi:hypothetical protein
MVTHVRHETREAALRRLLEIARIGRPARGRPRRRLLGHIGFRAGAALSTDAGVVLLPGVRNASPLPPPRRVVVAFGVPGPGAGPRRRRAAGLPQLPRRGPDRRAALAVGGWLPDGIP